MNEELRKHLTAKEIDWRIQSKKNNKTTVVPYIDNRAVMERFDKAFGVDGWCNSFERWGNGGGVKCGISVKCDSEWITKFDGADETNIEPTKGGFSDSMKRASVQWGLGRELYDYPRIFIDGEHQYIPDWAAEMLDKLVEAFIKGQLEGRNVVVLKQKK